MDPHFKYNADQHTLRLDKNLHQTTTNKDAFENYLNHSCNPNAYWDFSKVGELRIVLRAKHDIKVGEELNFNYFTTDEGRRAGETKGEDDFVCKCAARHHFNNGAIIGFGQLMKNDLAAAQALRHYLSPYLLSKLEEYESQHTQT